VLVVVIVDCARWGNDSTEIKRIANTTKDNVLELPPSMVILDFSSSNDYKGVMAVASVGQIHCYPRILGWGS
jgi:hypothetical protein